MKNIDFLVENIVLAFEKQFTDFSTKIYEEAIGE